MNNARMELVVEQREVAARDVVRFVLRHPDDRTLPPGSRAPISKSIFPAGWSGTTRCAAIPPQRIATRSRCSTRRTGPAARAI